VDGRGLLAADMSEVGGAAPSAFFVLTLDVPLNVVFRAPAPLLQPPPATSAHRRDVMSRDRHTPETVWRRREDERARRVESLSCPRSRSVCVGKYCSVRGTPLSTTPPRRPHSATTRRIHVATGVTSRSRGTVSPAPGSRDEVDRQCQLRRFLAAQQQQPSDVSDDVSDDDDDDDDDDESETTRREECWSESDDEYSDDQSASAMDQVREIVTRCRLLPVCAASTPAPRVDALQRRDTWTRVINHHATQHAQSSLSAQSIQQAILAAAADLVRRSQRVVDCTASTSARCGLLL